MAPAAQHIADRPFHIIYRHIVTEGGLRGCQADLMQLRLDGKDLNALVLEPGRIVARLDRNGIGQRLPVGQVMENSAVSWEKTACGQRRCSRYMASTQASLER